MSKKKEVIRNYRFADSYLVLLCNKIIVFILRDILQFAGYGVTAPTVTAYTGEVNDFEDLPSDIELASAQKVTTEEKDAAGESLKTGVRGVMTRVVTVYKEGSAKYEAFGVKGMDAMPDAELLKCGRRVVRVATEHLADFASTGLTALILTDLSNLCEAFEAALAKQEKAIADRDIATEDRIEMGNALYEKLMDYCGYGQTIWVETDEAKYNDYVIYNKSGGLANPIEMAITAGTTEMIIHKLYAADAVFVIDNTGGVKLFFGFCADASTPVSDGIDIASGESKTVTASDLGDFATKQYLNCTNKEISNGSFKIKLP